ncbi:MAG: SDR family NAD(P)-dependent oxidoreductase [Alphaproteobacteria bacterium]|nr:SDR family NAD(P)-dependent oxidoreductase [Alphaproteobacteria bacterium]
MPERVALVTGASAGIGIHTAIGLASAGMHVIMAGRDPARTEAARRFVADRAGAAKIEIMLADFASLDQVRRLAQEILARHDRLDVLVNNAGLLAPGPERSQDGFELTIAVNHLAPFLLTNLLLDRLKQSAPARVVTVASRAHRGARLDVGRLGQPGEGGRVAAYGRSKLCNILFTRELARRLAGSGVVAACLHPGVVATELGDRGGGLVGLGWRLGKILMISPEKGAGTSIFLATTPDPERFHGAYVVGTEITEPDAAARDDDLARRLWEESARLVGL